MEIDHGQPVGEGWTARAMRTTVFFRLPNTEPVPSASALWASALGDHPAEVSERGVANAQDIGRWLGGKAVTKVEPAGPELFRADLIWNTAWFKHAGDSILADFIAASERFLSPHGIPNASRIAFGIHAGWPAESRTVAYRRISTMVAGLTISPEMQEVVFRFNLPGTIPSGTDSGPALPTNRICVWSCQHLRALLPVPLPQGAPSGDDQIADEGQMAASCDLDINTSPEFDGDWGADSRIAILRELIEAGRSIINEGTKA